MSDEPVVRERQPTGIVVRGFKSIRDPAELAIRPLTVLAGHNSSGKSSVMQPLLLLKQTLEAPFDPGPLMLDGPNVKFSLARQMLWQGKRKDHQAQEFEIGFRAPGGNPSLVFRPGERGVVLDRLEIEEKTGRYTWREGMPGAEIRNSPIGARIAGRHPGAKVDFSDVARTRCFLVCQVHVTDGPRVITSTLGPELLAEPFLRLLHLPGLRGRPERFYSAAHVAQSFPGWFQDYAASVLLSWKERGDSRLDWVGDILRALDLTWKVQPEPLDDTRVEIRVGRLAQPTQGGGKDLVNIADVGVGVSQVLPLVVALLAAGPGSMIYVEQPEIHLHPRAQVALAACLLDAAKRGVVVVAETHSNLLLNGIQERVAAGLADPSLVALHWFARDPEGATRVASADLDAAGAFGDWPEDLADVELEIEDKYLRQANKKLGA